jgi:hypothetical protein
MCRYLHLQAQQVKDDLMLEFHVDDTAADEREDALTEMAFHVPSGNENWAGPRPEDPPAKVGRGRSDVTRDNHVQARSNILQL